MLSACMIREGSFLYALPKPLLTDYLVYERVQNAPCIGDIPDLNIQELLYKDSKLRLAPHRQVSHARSVCMVRPSPAAPLI